MILIKYALVLAALLLLAVFVRWAFLPARHLPGHRARHLRIRLHLRLHPGKGFATIVGLWLRWGRLAMLRRSKRIRRSLPLWHRLLVPAEHSVFLGRAHWRHRLRIPLEEHVLVMAPPRTFKTAFLADVILRYPGPVLATTTKADICALTAAVRGRRGPVHVFNPQHIGEVPSTFGWSPVEGCADPAVAIRRADAFDWQAVTRLLEPDRRQQQRPASRRLPGQEIGRLARWVAAQPEGNRNAGLFWAANRALDADPAADLSPLAAAARQAGLSDPEITRTLNSARRTGQGRPAESDHQAEGAS